MKLRKLIIVVALGQLLWSCQTIPGKKPSVSSGHLTSPAQQTQVTQKTDIPQPAKTTTALPPPTPEKREPVHTVVVNDVPLRDLLFSLARDANLNLDLDSNVSGSVTLNAINQPLPAILDRIAENNELRYHIQQDILRIQKDVPFIRNYQINYLNITRSARATVRVSTQISATGQGASSEAGGTGDNNSATEVQNVNEQNFWENLERNIAYILGGVTGSGTEVDHPDIMMNRGTGIMGVRATGRKHREIQAFVDEVQSSSQRQVMIEATIAEVKLSDTYQAGIDWNLLKEDVDGGWGATQVMTDISLFERPTFNMSFLDDDGSGNVLQATLSALETFGDVSVMSSPKVMAMNNQTALLKVVDNLVYFTVDVNIDEGSENQGRLYTYESEIHTVPVGFVMGVTPYVSSSGEVTLNVRPTISRVIGQVRDPNPALASDNVVNEIPVIQVREVESVLKVNSGDVAVIGGLMQDEVSSDKRGIPVLSRIPFVGPLFRYQDDNNKKTELVIFIKPLVVRHASVEKDLKGFQPFVNDLQSRFNQVSP